MNIITARLLQRARATITALSLLTFGALVAGCGSSGGGGGDTGAGVSPQTVTGVAATGSPLVGQVTLRDASSKDKTSNLASDGAFAIDVSDMTAPFILKATGTADGVDRTLFSFADKPGIANVNPLTTVALANAAGVDDPASVFDKPDAATLAKVKSGMPGSVAAIQTKLNPLLNAFSVANTNPVNAPFAADHNGLDAVFDNVKIVIANGTLTITNATTGAVLFTAQLKDIEHGRFTDNDDDVPKPGPRPAAPTGVTAVGGDGQVTVTWDQVANATAYDLFYSTKSRVAEEEDNDDSRATAATVAKSGSSSDDGESRTVRVKNATSPFVITGLAPSTTYFVIVRAINNGRRGPPSAEVSATTTATTPAPVIPAAPSGVSATGGTRQVTVTWTAVSGASSYNLYWSTSTGVTTANGTKISGIASPPAVHTNLTDNTTYFYVVTAVNSAGESAASAQVQATTLAATSTTTSSTATTSSTTAGSTTSTSAGTTSTTLGGGGTTTTAPTTTSTSTSTTSTTTTTTSTTSTTLALNGAALYATNCANCHNPLATSEKRGASVADINAGIAGVGSMRNTILSTNGGTALTQAQIAAISAALQ